MKNFIDMYKALCGSRVLCCSHTGPCLSYFLAVRLGSQDLDYTKPELSCPILSTAGLLKNCLYAWIMRHSFFFHASIPAKVVQVLSVRLQP